MNCFVQNEAGELVSSERLSGAPGDDLEATEWWRGVFAPKGSRSKVTPNRVEGDHMIVWQYSKRGGTRRRWVPSEVLGWLEGVLEGACQGVIGVVRWDDAAAAVEEPVVRGSGEVDFGHLRGHKAMSPAPQEAPAETTVERPNVDSVDWEGLMKFQEACEDDVLYQRF